MFSGIVSEIPIIMSGQRLYRRVEMVRHIFWDCPATCLGYNVFLFRLKKKPKRGEVVGFKVFKGVLLLSYVNMCYILTMLTITCYGSTF